MIANILGLIFLLCAVAIALITRIEGIKVNKTMVISFWACAMLSSIWFSAAYVVSLIK